MSKPLAQVLLLPISEIACAGRSIPCTVGGASLQVSGPQVMVTLLAHNIPTINIHLECDALKCMITQPINDEGNDEDNDNDNGDNDKGGDSVVMILDVALTRPMTKDVRDFWMAAEDDFVFRSRLGVKFAATSKSWVPQSYKAFVNSLAPNFSHGAFIFLNGLDASLAAWMELIPRVSDEVSNDVIVESDHEMEYFVFGAELGLGSGLGLGDVIVDVNNSNVLDLDDDDASGPIEPDTEEYVILNHNFLKSDRLTRTDFGRLEPGEWLSDNLIDLFISYFLRTINPALLPKVFSPLACFMTMLRKDGPSSLERWNVSKNLFDFDYILMPVMSISGDHWYLIIIDHPDRCRDVQAEPGSLNTTIFILDSRGPSEHGKDGQAIKKWLRHMAKVKGLEKTRTIEIACPKVPMQPNTDDCGLYVLHFARVFLQDPVKICQEMLDSKGAPWGTHIDEVWEHVKVPEMRNELRNIILE